MAKLVNSITDSTTGIIKPMEYRYKNIELTPSIFKELLITLFDGKQFNRQNAINTIISYHTSLGGTANKSTYVSVFKKAYQYLKNAGMTNVANGIYRLNFRVSTIENVENDDNQQKLLSFDHEYGNGSEFVYLYYFDIYRKYAELSHKNEWECKIGRTEKEALSRIINQSGTSYPETPHFSLLFKCDNSLALESSIHNILKVRGKWVSDSPGKEWFITSPDEVVKIYNLIIGNPPPECGEEEGRGRR